MNLNHGRTEEKYNDIRVSSLAAAKKLLPFHLKDKVDFRAIDQEALLWAKIWEVQDRHSWYFSKNYNGYARRHPKRLDLAVWHESYLCSLSIGIPVKTGRSMRLDIIESNPKSNPIAKATFDTNMIAFEIYAKEIGAEMIKIMRPLNAKLISFYRSKGFIHQKSGMGKRTEHLWKLL